MADDIKKPVTEEWPQEPDGFNDLKFGWTKEEVEQHLVLEQWCLINDGMANRDLPYPTRGNAHFDFVDIPIAASLIFTPVDGLHCIQGSFPPSAFERVKSAFIHLYGLPHEVYSEDPCLPEAVLKSVPEESLYLYKVKVESLLWYSSRVLISLTSHQPTGSLLVATASYMRNRSGWDKMAEKAKKKLACSEEVYQPPDGWAEEPDGFSLLKFWMTRADVEMKLRLGKRTDIKYGNVLYDAPLNVDAIEIAGTLTFNTDRLIAISGEFEASHWESVKATFISIYGKPHCHRREEIFEQGMAETLDWSGERTSIRLLDFPDGKKPRFHLKPSFKGAVPLASIRQTSMEICQVSVTCDEPTIGVEHTPSNLVLHMPDGNTIDYPRATPPKLALNASWYQNADGRFVYHYDLDTTNVSAIAIGERGEMVDDLFSEPSGWLECGGGWLLAGEPRSETARFSIESTKLPGPIPLSVSNRQEPRRGLSIPVTLPRRLFDLVDEALVEQMAFLNNRFIIGPSIPRGSGEGDLRELAGMWVDRYGFEFLKPVLDKSTPLLVALERINPMTPFEEQIVDCLKAR